MKWRQTMPLLLVVSPALLLLAAVTPAGQGYLALAPLWSQRIDAPAGMVERREHWYGKDVSPAGDVNADGYDDMVVLSSDRVYLYLGSPTGVRTTPVEVRAAPGLSAEVVAAAGDVNGDGYDDLFVLFYRTGRVEGSVLHLYRGTPDGLELDPGWVLATPGGWPQAPAPLAAGDVNGDGRPDLVVARWGSEASLYTDLDVEPVWRTEGRAAVAAGDVNGDGFGDLAVWLGERGYRLFLGSAAGLPTEPSWVFAEGSGLAAADFTGDGMSDLAIARRRQVAVYYGGRSGLGAKPGRLLRLDLLERYAHVLASGDVNGDGYADLAVQVGKNRVLLFRGSNKGLSVWPAWSMRDRSCRGAVLYPAGVGDINGDGWDDLAVGLPFCSGGGAAVIYTGGPRGLAGSLWFGLTAAMALALIPAAAWFLVLGVRRFKQTNMPLLTGAGLFGWLVLLLWLL